MHISTFPTGLTFQVRCSENNLNNEVRWQMKTQGTWVALKCESTTRLSPPPQFSGNLLCDDGMGNVPPSLQHLETWSPIGSTVWGSLDSKVFLEEVCHWAQALRLHTCTSHYYQFPLFSFNLWFKL